MFLWTSRKPRHEAPSAEEVPATPARGSLKLGAVVLAAVMLVGVAFLCLLARP